ncbi:unnamed protein product [Durusdinium trenchii]|uniref:Uncharacterized protein n=2 Tax=Durusdinium trenchii TaxID=1381693 RepID=A0ABP0SX23_9DINO|eukprot:g6255.t1
MSFERGDFFKIVALVNGRLLSIYDGVTEYAVGRILRSRALPQHRGGLYVARTPQEALRATFSLPQNSKLLLAPRMLLRCRVQGPTVEYNGKLAVSALLALHATPLADAFGGASYAARCRRVRTPVGMQLQRLQATDS